VSDPGAGDPLDGLPPAPGPSLVVAVAHAGAIGAGGGLPWHLPEDLAHFRRVTMGHTVIIGSATWRSIGRPLPGRRLLVVSARGVELPAGLAPEQVRVVGSPDDALAAALAEDPAPMVAGGAAIFEALLPATRRAYVTEIDVDVPDADTFVAPLDADAWQEVASWPGADPTVRYRVLDRRS
jgi:dihydrofolate reductase